MSLLVRDAPIEHFGWMFQRAQCAFTVNFKAIEALDGRGQIVGMTGFDMWTYNSVQIYIALRSRAALRALIYPTFQYVFDQLGLGVALATIRATNERSLALAKHAGFVEIYRVKDGIAPGEDTVHLEMRKENCRWLTTPTRKAA